MVTTLLEEQGEDENGQQCVPASGAGRMPAFVPPCSAPSNLAAALAFFDPVAATSGTVHHLIL